MDIYANFHGLLKTLTAILLAEVDKVLGGRYPVHLGRHLHV